MQVLFVPFVFLRRQTGQGDEEEEGKKSKHGRRGRKYGSPLGLRTNLPTGAVVKVETAAAVRP